MLVHHCKWAGNVQNDGMDMNQWLLPVSYL